MEQQNQVVYKIYHGIEKSGTFQKEACYLPSRSIAYSAYMFPFMQRRSAMILTLAAWFVMLVGATAADAQDTSSQATAARQAYNKVIGDVVSIAPDGSKMTVKPDSGAPTDVMLNPNTSYMLVPPGEKDLRKATRIDLKDISPGDRIYARSRKAEGANSGPAVSVIVMSKTQVAQHQEKTREEWTQRGSAGKVKAVDPAAKTVTIGVPAAGGTKDLVVQTDDKTTFRRYAPDSVKFSDAQPSDYSAIAVGNNVRVLGDKNSEGTSMHAEEIVSGSFRNIAGTVISVDPATNEIKVNDLLTKKPVVVKVNDDTNLRKLTPEMAAVIAHMAARASNSPGAPGAASASAGQPKGQGGPDSHPGFNGPAANQPASTTASTGNAPSGVGGHAGFGGHMDTNQLLDRSPKMTLADLKPGDALVISSTNGSDPSRVTAIAVVGGVEPILAATPPGASRSGGSTAGGAWNLDIGTPE